MLGELDVSANKEVCRHQLTPEGQSFRAVDSKHMDSDSALWRFADQIGTFPRKVRIPLIESRIEEPFEFASQRVESGEIASFIGIALRTGPSKVLHEIGAEVFARNNVIQLKAKCCELFRNPAILTDSVCTLPDELSGCRQTGEWFFGFRAQARIWSRKFPTRRKISSSERSAEVSVPSRALAARRSTRSRSVSGRRRFPMTFTTWADSGLSRFRIAWERSSISVGAAALIAKIWQTLPWPASAVNSVPKSQRNRMSGHNE